MREDHLLSIQQMKCILRHDYFLNIKIQNRKIGKLKINIRNQRENKPSDSPLILEQLSHFLYAVNFFVYLPRKCSMGQIF